MYHKYFESLTQIQFVFVFHSFIIKKHLSEQFNLYLEIRIQNNVKNYYGFFIPDVTSTHISQCFNAKKDTVQIVDVHNPFGHSESIS